MAMQRPGDCRSAVMMSSLIYDARNQLAKKAVDDGFDRMLWLDSDMQFEPDLLVRLANDMEQFDLDFVCGLYFARKPVTHPIIYKELIYDIDREKQTLDARAVKYLDYPKDSLFEIAASGFGAVLMKCSAMEKLIREYGQPFAPMPGFGEDITLCWRMKKLGMKMWCDSGVKLGHMGSIAITEAVYEEQRSQGLEVV